MFEKTKNLKWCKYEYNHRNMFDNQNIRVHCVGKMENGKITKIDDFKIKRQDMKIFNENKIKKK